jgi:hypothetical protein
MLYTTMKPDNGIEDYRYENRDRLYSIHPKHTTRTARVNATLRMRCFQIQQPPKTVHKVHNGSTISRAVFHLFSLGPWP